MHVLTGLGQLHEVDWCGVLGRPVVECLGREKRGPLGRVVAVPEDVLVAAGADRRVGQAVPLGERPPAAAARAGDVGVPRRLRVHEGVSREPVGVGEGVDERSGSRGARPASSDRSASLKPAASWFRPSTHAPAGSSARSAGTHPSRPRLVMANFLAPMACSSCTHES